MSVSFGKFQDSSDSRQNAKLNLASFKLKTTPFGVNLPKSFIWSDPKFTEVNGKTPAAFRLNWSRTPWSTTQLLFCCLGHLWAAAPPLQPCMLLCSRQQQPPQPGSFPLFCTPILQAVPQTLMPVDISQSYFNTGNMWRCFTSILLCNAEVSGSLALMLQNYSNHCNKLL